MRFSHVLRLVPQPSGAEAQCITGNKGVYTERLQRRNSLPLPDQVPLRARQQGEHKHRLIHTSKQMQNPNSPETTPTLVKTERVMVQYS